MNRHPQPLRLFLALLLIASLAVSAQEPTSSPKAEAELREAIRTYDDALRRGDSTAAERFWAAEYVFINPRGERVTRDARIANLRERRTSLDLVAHAPTDEVIRTYIDGRYGGEAERGEFRALVVWIHRDGRWQQLASQMTPMLPAP
jgi:hypothetical protein